MEPTSPKKIQFSDAPSHQLDPQAAEHIRRRRPTPATLVIYQAQTGEEEARATGGVSDVSEGSQRKQSTYTPPIMKELQLEVGLSESSPITAQHYGNMAQWANHNGPDEPNGNEAYLQLANEELMLSEGKRIGASSSQQDDLSSPGSVSR